MNLLALTGALLTASASVTTGSLKMDHHQNKMMDVEYKYQSNEVNSNDDLIYGHIYNWKTNDLGIDDLLSNDDVITFSLLTELSFNGVFVIDDATAAFHKLAPNTIYSFWKTSDTCFISLYLTYEQYQNDDYNITYTFDDVFTDDCVICIYYVNLTSPSAYSFFEYTDYNEIVPSSSHRGNLYTTIYDFFYGIFDTSDTNELSMTIMGQQMNLTSWLAHTVTIILLLLGVLWLILVIRWIFRVFSGLVKI